jgi:hypothetical protein
MMKVASSLHLVFNDIAILKNRGPNHYASGLTLFI